MSRRREKGAVTLLLVVVLLVLSALIGVLAVRGSTSDLEMSGAERQSRTNFYCAEAGLNAARSLFGANYGQWNTIFGGGTPTFPYPVTGDIDGDGKPDYSVTLADNVDELPNASDPTRDADLTAIMTSTCISPTLAGGSPHTLRQIVTFSGNPGKDYRFQAGHSSTHSGNEN